MLVYERPKGPALGNGLKYIVPRLLTFYLEDRLEYSGTSQVMRTECL